VSPTTTRRPLLTEADLRETFAGRSILITGGLGFIGSSVARRLVAMGARVLLVDSLIPEYGGNLFNVADVESAVRINIADVRDEHGMCDLVRGQDVLLNLAGQTSHLDSMRDPYTDLDINVRAQLSILEACRKEHPSIKIIYASTRQVYGIPDYLPVDERHQPQPVDVNGINKTAGEWYHGVYHRVYGIRTCVLRLTNTYGPRMRVRDSRQTFLGWWIRQIVEGREIQVYGDGTQLRDFTYVDDAVEAFLQAAASDAVDGEVFNVGGCEAVSLRTLAELLIRVAGSGRYALMPFPPEQKAIDIGDYHADDRKIRAALGWCPRVALAEGLARTVAYFREHGRRYWS
jgi:UDP-glucose 4-epimerase